METRRTRRIEAGAEVNAEFESIFATLREILRKHAGTLSVNDDSSDRYCLEASAGPTALRAWRGELRNPKVPVAWVQIGKAYVSYHLMGVFGNRTLLDGMSKELKARMQGKTCFNFKKHDEALFQELEELTARAVAALKNAGFITARKS